MKKQWTLCLILLGGHFGVYYFGSFQENRDARELREKSGEKHESNSSKIISFSSVKRGDSLEAYNIENDPISWKQSHPTTSDTESQKKQKPLLAEPSKDKAKDNPAAEPNTPTKITNGNGPSIGTIKVLGHRGCDANTQGWFLSVGNPEQYDFTVSDDGETVVVEPNTPNLTGNFEFNHCADPGLLVNKRVKFSAKIKAMNVTQNANLHLRGENIRREVVSGEETKLQGTFDWTDFSVEVEVSPEVTLFAYGVTFRSSGKLWISHPALSVVP